MVTHCWRLLIALLVSCTGETACYAEDWPQFLGPQRNGITTESALLPSWPKEGPPVVWQKVVGGGFSGPVMAGESLILFHRVGDNEVVACLDATTGKERWQYAYPSQYRDDFGMGDGPRSTPLIVGQHVYALGAEGHLLCLEMGSGKKVWERSLQTEYQVPKSFFGVATSPVVEGKLLLLNVGGKGAGIVAFDRNTGQEIWKATNHEASYSSPIVATLAERRRAVFFTREGVVVLDPQTGAVQHSKHWRSRLQASVNAASPLVVNDDIFVSACYGTGALLLHLTDDRLAEVWKNNEVMSNHYNTCVYHRGHLYGFDGRQEEGPHLRCVEWQTGKLCWTCEQAGCGSMILAGSNLLILSEHGDLVLAEASETAYREKARAKVMGDPCRSPIALANSKLYGRDEKKLVCWNLKQ